MGERRITILIVTSCLFQGSQISKQRLKIFPKPHHTVAIRDVSSISESDSFLLILRVKVQSTLQASKVRFQFINALLTYFFSKI